MVSKSELAVLLAILAIACYRTLGSVPVLVMDFTSRLFDPFNILWFLAILVLYRIYTWGGDQPNG